jgi:hypothetical protein
MRFDARSRLGDARPPVVTSRRRHIRETFDALVEAAAHHL